MDSGEEPSAMACPNDLFLDQEPNEVAMRSPKPERPKNVVGLPPRDWPMSQSSLSARVR